MEGGNVATPPQLAFDLVDKVRPYLEAVKMTNNYHFPTNRPGRPGAYFVARLKDASGQVVATLQLPDDRANFWVRHRQSLLAFQLADDQPIPPPGSEVIAAPLQEVPTITIWDMAENRKLKLSSVPQHLVPRDRPVSRPSDWSLLLVRSYARHLCRTHGAASAEIVRHTRESIPPFVLFSENMPAGAFDELVSSFGELPQ